ncbi:L-seryl-tRNA(Sec) selenium transferase [Bacillus sp. Marseille-P3661]|uniref:L-seryl-tRNA(Sec) selenium transferase n=1 Tax=Bacillus sp. Marseille-P3661 TaxID=1936234 RepID=UPI000C821E97|nr:L-seryl-tRNA(Sec) selenium transferase [Bacillus sp. Marseille-P3661]
MKQYLRYLPPVHELQKADSFLSLLETYRISESRLTMLVQDTIDQIRDDILSNKWEGAVEGIDKAYWSDFIFMKVNQSIERLSQHYLKRIINATGTILHTNLGRARLGDRVMEHVVQVAQNYSNLEYKISEGKRGSRHDIIEGLIKQVTGAEAAMVVNNNAAAVYLILRALAKDKEVIVSRGQLVEIGGSFRVSSIMEESGAKLVEVGTTNKTHLYDYENAVSEESAMILKVHTSNFKIVGFTEDVPSQDLIQLKNRHEHIIYYEDLGSGALYDFKQHGISEEPVVSEVINMGADLVSFSGDKLLGGPQAGIIAGKKKYIDKLKKHQLARVLRVDKMTFAALEATLKAYLLGEESIKEIPTIRDILQTPVEIYDRADKFKELLIERCGNQFDCSIEQEHSQIGGGTMPDVHLVTFVAAISNMECSSEQLATKLRHHTPSIVTRQKDEKVLLDFRTITDDEIPYIIAAFSAIS